MQSRKVFESETQKWLSYNNTDLSGFNTHPCQIKNVVSCIIKITLSGFNEHKRLCNQQLPPKSKYVSICGPLLMYNQGGYQRFHLYIIVYVFCIFIKIYNSQSYYHANVKSPINGLIVFMTVLPFIRVGRYMGNFYLDDQNKS